MHPALYIEEILLNIFSYCYTRKRYSWPPPPFRYANVHLAALARTCRTFKEPALDMIWAELDDLTPLVRCLPKASWIKVEHVSQFMFYTDERQRSFLLQGLLTPKTA